MHRTLLIGCLTVALAACAEDGFDEPTTAAELAAVGESPWVDDAPPASTDPWDLGEDDGDPWIDPPRNPPRTSPATPGAAAPGTRDGYDFENNKQGWTPSGPPITNAMRSTAQHASGESSLEVTFDGAGVASVSVTNPPLRAGARVSFAIFVPSGARLKGLQPYVQRGPAENWAWTGTWTPISALRQSGWTTVSVQVPADARTFGALGVQFETAGAFRGRVYIDDVRFY
jgi:hypothetical protein